MYIKHILNYNFLVLILLKDSKIKLVVTVSE